MTDPERELAEARRNRADAHRLFQAGVTQVRADLAARGIGGRIKARAGHEAKAVLDEALDIASESKGIVAATVAALVLWFARNPIIALVEDILAPAGNDADAEALPEESESSDGAQDSD